MRGWGFGIAVMFAACAGGDDTTDTTDTTVDTSDADTDADSDADTDADSDADTDADSDTDSDVEPPTEVLASFEPAGAPIGDDSVDASTSWAILAPSVSGQVTSVDLWLSAPSGLTDPLTVELIADSNGPFGDVLATVTAQPSAFPTDVAGFGTVTFDTPVSVSGAVWIALSMSTTATGNYGAKPYDTGNADHLAVRFSPGTWEMYGKSYEWPYRVTGIP